VEHKGEVDLVTEHDRRAEAIAVETLARELPDHAVIGEEGGEVHTGGDRPVWYVDPLDGTTNYAHRMPWYAVSIGLEVEGEPVLGVVRAPALGWELWGAQGRGTYFGDEPARVSGISALDGALVATGFPYDRRTSDDNNLREVAAVMRRCQGVRRTGVASLDCLMVAWGVLDAYWEFRLKPWDISAGAALVRGAGGRVTALDGGPFRSRDGNLVATNGLVHDELLDILREVRSSGDA
jgi:myo-inositol-1(or 4)-monophosphatase